MGPWLQKMILLHKSNIFVFFCHPSQIWRCLSKKFEFSVRFENLKRIWIKSPTVDWSSFDFILFRYLSYWWFALDFVLNILLNFDSTKLNFTKNNYCLFSMSHVNNFIIYIFVICQNAFITLTSIRDRRFLFARSKSGLRVAVILVKKRNKREREKWLLLLFLPLSTFCGFEYPFRSKTRWALSTFCCIAAPTEAQIVTHYARYPKKTKIFAHRAPPLLTS